MVGENFSQDVQLGMMRRRHCQEPRESVSLRASHAKCGPSKEARVAKAGSEVRRKQAQRAIRGPTLLGVGWGRQV